jgi:hypothetical protein
MISSLNVSTTRWTVTQLGCSDDLHLSSYSFNFRLDGIFPIPFSALCSTTIVLLALVVD